MLYIYFFKFRLIYTVLDLIHVCVEIYNQSVIKAVVNQLLVKNNIGTLKILH